MIILIPFFFTHAADSTSASFKVIDSRFGNTSEMSSTNFSLLGSLSQISIGSSTAATFVLNSGFLYFPKVTSPVLSASAGQNQVTLDWTAAQGFLGTNIGGYLVGQSTVSGGPYNFTSVGNVTNAVRSSLTNGQTYYFLVQAQDAFGAVVATSSEVSAVPTAPTTPPVTPPSTGGGGGGGGGSNSPTASTATKITLKGLAYPLAKIIILKDASVGANVVADAGGNFQATFSVSSGIYSFGIYALDSNGFKSPTFGFSVNTIPNQTVTTSDIIVAPTISSDKSEVKIGNTIKFFGYSYPISSINITVNSQKEVLDKTVSDKYGRWTYSLKTGGLEMGDHTTRSQTVASSDLASAYSSALAFEVGNEDVLNTATSSIAKACSAHGDINNDGKVNITDFSILMYFWNKTNPANPCADVNNDSKVDLKDFSILLYWWTGNI